MRDTSSAPAACASGPRGQSRARPSQQARAPRRHAAAKPAWHQALERASAALRRALDSRGRGREGAAPRAARGHHASACADGRVAAARRLERRHRGATSRSTTWSTCAVAEAQGQARRGGPARAPDVQGRRRPREQDRTHPRDDGRLLLCAEPSRPQHAGAAPAGIDLQAAHVSGGARAAACSRTRWFGTRRSRWLRSAAATLDARPRGLLVAQKLRRRQRPAS